MVALSTSSSSKYNSDHPSSCLIEVWDVEKAALVETYVSRTGSASDPVTELVSGEVVGADVESTAASAISALIRTSQEGGTLDDFGDVASSAATPEMPHPLHGDVRTMVVGSDFGAYIAHQRPEFGELDMFPSSSLSRTTGRGFIVTGSEDAKLRLWDLGKFEKSTVLSGTESDMEKPSYRFVFFVACFAILICLDLQHLYVVVIVGAVESNDVFCGNVASGTVEQFVNEGFSTDFPDNAQSTTAFEESSRCCDGDYVHRCSLQRWDC